MIDTYEIGEQFDPTLPAVLEFRTQVDTALTDLDGLLDALSLIERPLD